MKWLGLILLAGFCLLIGYYIYLVEYRTTASREDAPDAVSDDADVIAPSR
jgi:hypothetical protein